jgi:hypothetical protein
MTSRRLFIVMSGQKSIPHKTVMFYRNLRENVRRRLPKFSGKSSGCCITTKHHLTFSFPPGNLLPKSNVTADPPPLLFSVSPTENTIWRPLFWHNWSDRGRITGGAELPHRIQLPGGVHTRGWEYLEGDGGRRSEVMFWLHDGTSLSNYEWLFVSYLLLHLDVK